MPSLESPESWIAIRPSARWRAPDAQLQWAQWDGEYVLHHVPSGKTHFVNAATRALLTQVLHEPAGFLQISEAFAQLQGLELDEALREQLWELLRRLEDLGLVVPA